MNSETAKRWFFVLRSAALCGGVAVFLAGVALAGPGSDKPTGEPESGKNAPSDPVHYSTKRTGTVETSDRLTLRLSTDLGSVHIVPLDGNLTAEVQYSVQVETDARPPLAQRLLEGYTLRAKATPFGVEIVGALPSLALKKGAPSAQISVQYEVKVPAGYNLEVKTEGGDIETGDVGGTANLSTQGGNIRTGRLGLTWSRNGGPGRSVARLETDGGHIQVQDVAGDLTAITAGGHINANNIAGDASLRTGGGHIQVAGEIRGRADLDTEGGNITVGAANRFVSVRTGGGQIDFGEVRGSVRAQTGGGGIRVLYVAGPMQVESSSGSICLTKVAGTVQAATREGTITAWINPEAPSSGGKVQLAGASQLSSGNGDLIVFVPRNLAATIEALVASGDAHLIEFDQALHLAMQPPASGNGPLRGVATLNGGGPPLKLRTTGGKIRVQFLDSQTALRESLIQEQKERLKIPGCSGCMPVSATVALPTPAPQPAEASDDLKADWLESFINQLEIMVSGGLRENPKDFRKRLTYSPAPPYPALAQRAGVEGRVSLEVRVLKDGRVEFKRLLEGEPSLADAAIAAVKNWRGQPMWINGKPKEVISVVTFDFQLRPSK
jgi:TonB family protein